MSTAAAFAQQALAHKRTQQEALPFLGGMDAAQGMGAARRAATRRTAAAGGDLEGGGSLVASLIKAGLADKAALFYSPKLLGADAKAMVGALGLKGLDKAPLLKDFSYRRVGDDLLVEGYF